VTVPCLDRTRETPQSVGKFVIRTSPEQSVVLFHPWVTLCAGLSIGSL
jgi:hypothetical protein